MNTKLNYNLTIEATCEGFKRPAKQIKTKNKAGETITKFEEDTNGNIIEDMAKVQVITIIKNDNGKEIKETFTLHQTLTDEQLTKMLNKTFIFEGIEQYAHKNGDFTSYTYSASKINKEIESKEKIFNIKNSLTAIITNIATQKEDTIFQLKIKDGFRIDIKDIKLKDTKAENFKHLLNKKVFFENVKVFKGNGKSYLSIDKAPTEVK